MWGVAWCVCSSPLRILRNFSVLTSPGPQGPLRRVPGTSEKLTFFKWSKRCHVGCRLKRLLKPVKNFEKKSVSTSAGPQGLRLSNSRIDCAFVKFPIPWLWPYMNIAIRRTPHNSKVHPPRRRPRDRQLNSRPNCSNSFLSIFKAGMTSGTDMFLSLTSSKTCLKTVLNSKSFYNRSGRKRSTIIN